MIAVRQVDVQCQGWGGAQRRFERAVGCADAGPAAHGGFLILLLVVFLVLLQSLRQVLHDQTCSSCIAHVTSEVRGQMLSARRAR